MGSISQICSFIGCFYFFAVLSTPLARAQVPQSDWQKFYYKNPQPNRFVDEVRIRVEAGDFKEKSKGLHPAMTAFYGQIMSQNPDRIESWLEELSDMKPEELDLLYFAAWLSDTPKARDYFRKHNLKQYLRNQSAGVLKAKLDNPTILSALWGSFRATGDLAYVRHVVTALDYESYVADAQKVKGGPTEVEKPKARLGVIFVMAKASLESNAKNHPLVVEHCEKILAETPDTAENASRIRNLRLILAEFKPDKYKSP